MKQYSTDEGSKAQNGDVGWDLMSSFVTEYTDALATLEAATDRPTLFAVGIATAEE